MLLEVRGYIKGKPKHLEHLETWWWNKDVDVAVCRKRSYLEFVNRVGMRKIGRKYCEVKKMLRE